MSEESSPRTVLQIFTDGSVFSDTWSGCGVVAYHDSRGFWEGIAISLGSGLNFYQAEKYGIGMAVKFARANLVGTDIMAINIRSDCHQAMDEVLSTWSRERRSGEDLDWEIRWNIDRLEDAGIAVEFQKVKGHSNAPECEGNRLADDLAKAGARVSKLGAGKGEWQEWRRFWPGRN